MANLPFATIDSHARALGKPSMSQHDRDLVLCVVAGDLAVARALLVAVQDDALREQIFKTAPA
jgi:hypothetical protein